MLSLIDSALSVAACDQSAIDPFDAVAGGPLSSLEQMWLAERFVRTVVLHDEVVHYIEPLPAFYPGTNIQPLRLQDGRVQVGQWIRGTSDYLRLVKGPLMAPLSMPELSVTLSQTLVGAMKRIVRAEPGDPHYEQNLYYMQSLTLTAKRGGSVVCAGPIGSLLEANASEYPLAMFEKLDEQYRQFARQAHAGFDLTVPPVMSLVLQRAGRRDRIIDEILALKEEWADARRRLWEVLNALRGAKTPADAASLVRELRAAAASMSSSGAGVGSGPLEVLWNLVDKSAAGAVESWIGAGHPVLGVVSQTTVRALMLAGRLGKRLFGRGAFTLGRRVRKDIASITPTRDLLAPMLTDAERRTLGL